MDGQQPDDRGPTEPEGNEDSEDSEDPKSLSGILDQLEADDNTRPTSPDDPAEGSSESVSVRDLRSALGSRAYGPIFVISGLLCLTPVGVVPGVPTALSFLVLAVSVQFVLGREQIWLPTFLLNREVSSDRLEKSLRLLRRVARVLDPIFRPRLTWLVEGRGSRAAAVVIGIMGLVIPPLEFIPFTVTLPATVIAAFGLGLVTRDGLILMGSMIAAATGFILIIHTLL